MDVYLVDGTYELFRHFFAVPAAKDASGQEIGAYRPPYGIFSASTVRAVRRRGWWPILWSQWGKVWTRRATAQSIARRATAGVKDLVASLRRER